jgi:TPR repeat protein
VELDEMMKIGTLIVCGGLIFMGAGCADWDRSDPDGSGYLSAADRRLQEERARSGDTEAMWRLELHYGFVEDRERSKYWQRRAAEAGNLTAMREFGAYLCNAKDLVTKKEGWQWLEKAHAAGHRDATKDRGDLRCKAEIESLGKKAEWLAK